MAKGLLEGKDPEHVLAAMLNIAYKDEFNEDHYNQINKVETKVDGGFRSGSNGSARIFLALGKKA